MEVTGGQIVVGVVSGLVAGVLLLVVTHYWQKALVPWLEERQYKGIRLAGTWELEDVDSAPTVWSQRELLILEQNAGRISGSQVLYPKDEHDLDVKTLELAGTVQDGFVTFMSHSRDGGSLSRGVFLGQVTSGGERLHGDATFVNLVSGGIQSDQVRYRRVTGSRKRPTG